MLNINVETEYARTYTLQEPGKKPELIGRIYRPGAVTILLATSELFSDDPTDEDYLRKVGEASMEAATLGVSTAERQEAYEIGKIIGSNPLASIIIE